MSKRGVYVLGLDRGKPFDLKVILKTLAALGVTSVLVEGGPTTAGEFLKRRLVDKVHIFIAHRKPGSGKSGVELKSSLITLRRVATRSAAAEYRVEGLL